MEKFHFDICTAFLHGNPNLFLVDHPPKIFAIIARNHPHELATLAPDVFPAAFRGSGGSVAVYFEAAAVITVLVLLGQVLELRARETTSGNAFSCAVLHSARFHLL
jgi:cation transport ATPase